MMTDKDFELDIIVGMTLGYLTILTTDSKETTVECRCGTISTYKTSRLKQTNAARMCSICAKKGMQTFLISTSTRDSKYPTLDEDVSRVMIDNFIKERK